MQWCFSDIGSGRYQRHDADDEDDRNSDKGKAENCRRKSREEQPADDPEDPSEHSARYTEQESGKLKKYDHKQNGQQQANHFLQPLSLYAPLPTGSAMILMTSSYLKNG